jgi:hypothetical protein
MSEITPIEVGVNFYTPPPPPSARGNLSRLQRENPEVYAAVARLSRSEQNYLNRQLKGLADGEFADVTEDDLLMLLAEGPDETQKNFTMPRHALVIDTETAAASTPTMPGFEDWKPEGQALHLLRALWCEWTGSGYQPRQEYLVYADNLPEQGVEAVRVGMRARRFADRYETDDPPHLPLYLLSLTEFRPILRRLLLSRKSYLVGFNLFFDLTRLALDFKEARRKMEGGFSTALFADQHNPERPHPFAPRLLMRRLDNMKTFYRWGTHAIPDGKGGLQKDENGRRQYRHYDPLFLDLRTLLYALFEQSFTLRSAAVALLPPDQHKGETSDYGKITPEHIAYLRQDCYSTLGLLNVALAEWQQMQISTPPHFIYSTASIAKAYFKDAGLKPHLELQPDFPPEIMGYAMNAYYGGRVDALLRRVLVPAVHVDFRSMYPAVRKLMGLAELERAAHLDVSDVTAEAQQFLDAVTLEDLFKPETWHHPILTLLVQLKPDGDILPVRGRYNHTTDNIGINPFWGDPQWYMMGDVIAAKLLADEYARQLNNPTADASYKTRVSLLEQWPTQLLQRLRSGRTAPQVLQAIRLVPSGLQPDLKPVMLRGVVKADPRADDMVHLAIEERFKIKRGLPPYDTWSKDERDRTQLTLKIFANAGGYGIYAERNREDFSKPQSYPVYSDGKVSVKQNWREKPGRFYFAPLAAATTAAARLMLALLEIEVSRRNGTYVTGDTDSMYIAADQTSREMSLIGVGADGKKIEQTVKLLSWADVEEIVARFTPLNPFRTIPGSLVQIEDDNFNLTGQQQRLHCYSISSKRYCLLDDNHEIVDNMESALADFWHPSVSEKEVISEIERRARIGVLSFRDKERQAENVRRFKAGEPLLSPAEIEEETARVLEGSSRIGPPITARDMFITGMWDCIVNKTPLAAKGWNTDLEIYQRSVSTPYTWHLFDRLNASRPLRDQMKPGNFYARASYYGQPEPDKPRRMTTIIAPFTPEKAPLSWGWFYAENGQPVEDADPLDFKHWGWHVDPDNFRRLGRNKASYDEHPEHPYNGPDGQPCVSLTRGLLMRRPVSAQGYFYTGKQTPSFKELFDEQEETASRPLLVHDASSAPLQLALVVLRDMDIQQVAARLKTTERAVQRWLQGKRQPEQPARFIELAVRFAQTITGQSGLDALRAYPAARQALLDAEQEAVRSLADWQVAKRYGVSLRSAQRMRAGQRGSFQEVLRISAGV